jgi:hypothetical protein
MSFAPFSAIKKPPNATPSPGRRIVDGFVVAYFPLLLQ